MSFFEKFRAKKPERRTGETELGSEVASVEKREIENVESSEDNKKYVVFERRFAPDGTSTDLELGKDLSKEEAEELSSKSDQTLEDGTYVTYVVKEM